MSDPDLLCERCEDPLSSHSRGQMAHCLFSLIHEEHGQIDVMMLADFTKTWEGLWPSLPSVWLLV